MNHKTKILGLVLIIFFMACKHQTDNNLLNLKTFCNPLNLSYQFCLDQPSRREAADPTIILFKDKYYLFASKSGGYWCSDDLLDWKFIKSNELPLEDYAPTAFVLNDTVYFMASSHQRNSIYKSVNPENGNWSIALDSLEIPVWDPAFFLDDDNRLYLFWGCSDKNPIYGVEVDYKNNFKFLDSPKNLKYANSSEFGWEVPGDYNNLIEQKPWIEGAWLNKYKGKYYLQYSGPGTEFKSYSDGVYIADNPLGPYSVATHNPFAYKPGGFAAGAGHGSTFKDKFGNYWHIGTATISVKHIFERRLVLFPAFFDKQGLLYTNTRFGDYPMLVPI
ncbi:MAG: family 43 glycosylhydrolase, partial [Bacteroidales bacterium]|nr:family 43 glycosylhydrolase [Bacteroidales bacterium]